MTRRSTKGNFTIRVASVLLVLLFLFCTSTTAIERLRFVINDTVAAPGGQAILEVYLINVSDDIATIDIRIFLSTSDIAHFIVESESGQFGIELDTMGTLLSGCQSLSARAEYTGESGLDLRLIASTQWTSPPRYLPPGSMGVLFRVPVILESLPPVPLDDYTAKVFFDDSWEYFGNDSAGNSVDFNVITPEGESIGWIPSPEIDTVCLMCTEPIPPPGTGCAQNGWEPVSPWENLDDCDSVGIFMVGGWVLDESQVRLFPGSITMHNWTCGDLNSDGNVTISDISIMIDHLFISHLTIDPIEPGNVNCSTEQPIVLTIGDISVLIDRLFITQTPLCCEVS